MASDILLYPEPLGPLTAVNPFLNSIIVFLPKLLKFSISNDLRYIPSPCHIIVIYMYDIEMPLYKLFH